MNTLFIGFFESYVYREIVGGEVGHGTVDFEQFDGRSLTRGSPSGTVSIKGRELIEDQANKRKMTDFMIRNYLEALHR